MGVSGLPGSVSVDRSPPTVIIKVELKGVEVVPKLEMKLLRDLVTPSEQVDRVATGDLINIRHDQQVIVADAGDPDELIQCHSLVRLLDERILPFDEPPPHGPVGQPRLYELEAAAIAREEEGLLQGGEGRVGLEQNELGDEGAELVPPHLEDVELIVEEDGVEDAPWRFPDAPAMELAQVLHGDVLVVVVRYGPEGFRGGFPQRPEEVGELLAVDVDDEDKDGDTDEEQQ